MKRSTSSYLREYGNKDTMKSIGWLALGVFVLVFFSKITRKIMSLFNPVSETELEKQQDQTATVNKLVGELTGLPKSMSHYMTIADALEIAMQGWGTDWKILVESCQNLTKIELLAVYKCFGARINEDFANESFDLFGWFNDEYSSFSLPCLKYYPLLIDIWQKSGLPLTFKR